MPTLMPSFCCNIFIAIWNCWSYLLTIFKNCMLIFSLEELYLSGNSYTDVTLNIPAYQSLRLLQLTSNSISDWLQITKLDQLFPNLDNLVLAENPISNCGKTIKCYHCESVPDALKFHVYFSVIMKLQLNDQWVSNEWNPLLQKWLDTTYSDSCASFSYFL